MTFSVLTVRTGEEPETDLYPDPGDTPDSVELSPADGTVQRYDATALTTVSLATGTPRQLSRLHDLAIALIVTDSRVAIACTKYTKGGGFTGLGVGAMAVAVTANTVSKARATRRQAGKMLVGHVRYDWLGHIEAKDRTGMLSPNIIQLLFGDPTGADGLLILDIWLHKRQPATPIAEDIARRAATYKAHHVADDVSRPRLLAYAQQPSYTTLDNGTHRYVLPPAIA